VTTTNTWLLTVAATIAALLLTSQPSAAQHAVRQPTDGRPDATVDLRTRDGVAHVSAEWRYSDAPLIETDFRSAGPDMKPTGRAIKTLDQGVKAGSVDFDDRAWQTLDPTTLESRRGNGKVSFAWYRLNVTIPQRVGSLATAGSTVVFEIVVDDYAEIWVDGQLPRILGQTGGALVKGFNAPNRVVLTRDARPGQRIQLAVFAANAPLSDPPPNYIWIRSATLDFFKTPGHSGANQ
jgi:gluconolactonase